MCVQWRLIGTEYLPLCNALGYKARCDHDGRFVESYVLCTEDDLKAIMSLEREFYNDELRSRLSRYKR